MKFRCHSCGEFFQAAARGRVPIYCTGKCRQWAYRQRRAGKVVIPPWLRPLPHSIIPGVCPFCGGDCAVTDSGWNVCGDASCRDKYTADRRHWLRAAGAGVDFELIDRDLVYERDEWVCGICSGSVSRDIKGQKGAAPSLDHIVPISRGGKHIGSNVRLAHLWCNIKKNAKLDGEMEPLSEVVFDEDGVPSVRDGVPVSGQVENP